MRNIGQTETIGVPPNQEAQDLQSARRIAQRDHAAAVRILGEQYEQDVDEQVERDQQRLVESLAFLSPATLHVLAIVAERCARP
jgi:hypothetical protein